MHRFSHLCLYLGLASASFAGPTAAEELTVVTWGGAYEAAQRAAVFEPFAEATGIPVEVLHYDGTASTLAERAAADGWDVIDMLLDQAQLACAEGLLLEIDPAALLGEQALADFAPVAPSECTVPQNIHARVLAYNEHVFGGVKPTRIEDFFDLEQFPGRRALQKSPDGILEWAMLAEGVPPEQVYGLLSTDRGLRLAFRRLESIREQIVWWEDPAEPAEMLADGRAAMAAGYNGRFFDAAEKRGVPLDIVWDGAILGVEVWAIAAGTDMPEAARRFLAHAAEPDVMARLAERIPYGPARLSAFARIGSNPITGTPMRAFLPSAPQHRARALVRDATWYANTEELRARRFAAWLAAGATPGAVQPKRER